jgi:hypothetical protein
VCVCARAREAHAQLNDAFFTDENILSLDVPMDDVVVVKVEQSPRRPADNQRNHVLTQPLWLAFAQLCPVLGRLYSLGNANTLSKSEPPRQFSGDVTCPTCDVLG